MSTTDTPKDPEVTPNRWITSPKGRKYLYGIALAVSALLAFYGLITDESLALWGTLAASVLSLPVAAANTPKGGKRGA
ncbi:hypothetical protein [Brachybacterium sp.]|uniref:phage holin n=1 Tax=Brachybacterium sp. TaxID=1891286 RepID=UPI0026476484|nr:hypothetical protein [Brachybacterium sp.]